MTKDEALAQPDAFEQGRQEGMKQEKALRALSRLGQEIEAQPEQERVNRYCQAGMCVESDKLHEVRCTAHRSPPLPVQPERPWVGLMRGVRVEGDTVVISVKGGNDAARELCGALLEEKNK